MPRPRPRVLTGALGVSGAVWWSTRLLRLKRLRWLLALLPLAVWR